MPPNESFGGLRKKQKMDNKKGPEPEKGPGFCRNCQCDHCRQHRREFSAENSVSNGEISHGFIAESSSENDNCNVLRGDLKSKHAGADEFSSKNGALLQRKDMYYYCKKDLRVQTINYTQLKQLPWYDSQATSDTAKHILKGTDTGTFILRDSQDPKYLYALSVKTKRGITSIRIMYNKGQFQLDCVDKLKDLFPKFDTIVGLVDHYVRSGQNGRRNTNRFLESSGRKDMPVLLKKPLLRDISSLEHLARLSFNRSLPKSVDDKELKSIVTVLNIPTAMKEFLVEYPFLN